MSGNGSDPADLETAIAVVGSAVHFPGARDVRSFWQNLREGVESIRRFTDDELRAEGVPLSVLRDPRYVRAGAVLDEMEYFDAEFFNLSPRDASIMDPQHRHLLECAWEVLEDAGHPPEHFDGSIGVFAGCGMNAYMMYNLLTRPDLVENVGMFLLRHTGNDKDFLSTRVSYDLDLKGPSVNVQTACSTSLVAIHMAAQSLLSHECDMALAGGVTIELPHRRGYVYQEGEILSPDGHCHAFDHRAQGTIFGSGAGLVALRRLEDALEDRDTIHAIVRGSAINNDGAGKVGYLAPSVDGQAAAIAEALSVADVGAETIGYVEAHGTGTAMGDPIEIAALTQAFRQFTDESGFCAIGSVKTNIGHLDTAAGIANFVKVVESLRHRELPPSLNYERPNPTIDFDSSPFFVNDQLRPWEAGDNPRRAGVSSLGVGGTNAHLIVEEAPVRPASPPPGRSAQLLPLSARSEASLDSTCARLADALREDSELPLADVAYTLQAGRRAFPVRRVLACSHAEEAASLLESGDRRRVFTHTAPESSRPVAFLLPGGGAQYPRMGLDLYEREPVFREHLDRGLDAMAAEHEVDLRELLFAGPGQDAETDRILDRPSVQLPLIFMTSVALAELWRSLGVEPQALIGHSMGENTAACLSGVLSYPDALGLVALRGRLFEEIEPGGMLSIPLPADRVKPLLGDSLDLASVNSPELCVVSGPAGPLSDLEQQLQQEDTEVQRVAIAIAAHSRMLEPILGRFGDYLRGVELHAPEIPFISNTTGTWITEADATDPEYWVRHLRQTVQYADGVRALHEGGEPILLEVGPGKTLGSLSRQVLGRNATVLSSLRHRDEDVDDDLFFLTGLGRLWAAGADVELSTLHGDEPRQRRSLPTYAFERKRHWIEPGTARQGALDVESDQGPERLPFEEWFSEVRFDEEDGPRFDRSRLRSASHRWLLFAETFGESLARRLEELGQHVIRVHAGSAFEERGGDAFVLDPAEPDQYAQLLERLAATGGLPDRIVHSWSVTGPSRPDLAEVTGRGFESLLHLGRAMALGGLDSNFSLAVVSDGLHALGGEAGEPEKATLLGPVRVIPREFSEVACASLDLPKEGSNGDATLVDAVLAEIEGGLPASVVAYRGGRRLVERRAPLVLDAEPDTPGVRDEAVVIVTGGLGGIGLAMSRFLAEHARARLVLLSRRGLPAREDWDEAIRTGAPEAASIRAVRELEELGAEVLVRKADVSDPESLTGAIDAALDRFGAIHGVLHGAGVLEDGAIAGKTLDSARLVLQPKVAGTLALERSLRGQSLDFFVVFSSTSVQLGLAGQVDYTAANAFLNAFARARDGHPEAIAARTLALGWGTWSQVGMAAETARRLGLVAGDEPEVPIAHPLLQHRVASGPDRWAFEADYRIEDLWVLSEHRIREFGALLPGTGYIELLRAAAEAAELGAHIRIEDLVFIRPLRVEDDLGQRVRVELRRANGGFEALVMTRSGEDERGNALWLDHAQALLLPDEAAPETRSIEELRARCDGEEQRFAPEHRTRQEQHLDFGPRWRNLRSQRRSEHEALVQLELPEAYTADLQVYGAHPSLLDMATGQGLELLTGPSETPDLFVPMTYESVRLLAPLTARLYAHVRSRPDNDVSRDAVTFDLTLLDPRGQVLMEIRGFSMRRIPAQAALDEGAGAGHPLVIEEPEGHRGGGLGLLSLGVREGIRPAEGGEALRRLLAQSTGPEVLVSSLDLVELSAQAAPPARSEAREAREPSGDAHAPADSVEQVVADIWSDLLGVEDIARNDEFFDIGGHSLLGIRVVNRLNQQFSLDLTPAQLFEHPTVALLAGLIRERKPDLAGEKPMSPTSDAKPDPVPTREPSAPASQEPTADLHKIGEQIPASTAALAPTESGQRYAMQEHWLCRTVLAPLFSIRRVRLRRWLQYLILKLEGGEWFTVTLRKIYAKHYDLEIGAYTGSCFSVGQFKRGTRIGRYCSIFPSARIETANHPSNTISSNGLFYRPEPGFSPGYPIPRNRVEIGHDVHIGHNATILYPCSKIGNGAIIGAGTLVDFDVPPYAIVAGSPATILRFRFSKEKIAELEASRWWDASLESLESVRDEFVRPVEGRSVR